MCGFAFADPQRSADQATIDRMAAALAHRGPDGSGSARAAGVGLGFRRLSIIDLASGDQPIASEDGAVSLVCNGEVYNAPELRAELQRAGHRFRSRSDAEVIVHLYEDLGPECLSRLRGMFALALWDARLRRLMLARDRFGIKPLVYALRRDALWFASESKAILAAGVDGGGVDPHAIDDLLALAFVAGPHTLFSGIRRLPPAHLALYQHGALTLRRYWALPEGSEPPRTTREEWAEALRAKLEEAVRLHLRSDVPVGAWLSPGLDSSAIACLAAQEVEGPLPTFTLAFDDPTVDETSRFPTLDTFPGHRMVNERARCRDGALSLFPRAVWAMEEPTAWGVEIPRMILAEATARRVKVVVTGEGSDEIFGGYAHYRMERVSRRAALLPLALRRAVLAPLLRGRRPAVARLLAAPRAMSRERYACLVGPLHGENRRVLLSAETLERLASAPEEEDRIAAARVSRAANWFDAVQRCDLALRLPDLVNHSLDRGSMAYGLEARVPFLDHELVELAAGIPSRLKAGAGIEKGLLREAMRTRLPDEVRLRGKRGFGPPFESWMRGPLPPFAEELLSERALARKGHFDPGAVVSLMNEQRAGRRRLGAVLLAVLGVQLWDELFVRGTAPSALA